MTDNLYKQKQSETINNLLAHRMLPQSSVIIVNQDQNIIAKIAKCLGKTK